MGLKLPNDVATKDQVLGILDEIGNLIEAIIQDEIRSPRQGKPPMEPKVSPLLHLFLEANGTQLSPSSLRAIKTELEGEARRFPVVRVIFASEPTLQAVTELAAWFRKASGEQVVLKIGLQPSIAGGCIIQTTNRRYDFSLRTKLLHAESRLKEAMAGVR